MWSNVRRITLSADNAGPSLLTSVLLNVTPYRWTISHQRSRGLQCLRNVEKYSHNNTALHPIRLKCFCFWSVCRCLCIVEKQAYYLRRVRPVRLSACISADPTGRNFVTFDTVLFYGNLLRNSKVDQNRTNTWDTLQEYLFTFYC